VCPLIQRPELMRYQHGSRNLSRQSRFSSHGRPVRESGMASSSDPANWDRGSRLEKAPPPPRCCFPNCRSWGEQAHHITYPDAIERLCDKHHRQITLINWQECNRRGHSLSDRARRTIYRQWKRRQLKVIWNRAARDWLKQYWTDSPGP